MPCRILLQLRGVTTHVDGTLLRNGAGLREADEEICDSINEKNPARAHGDRRSCSALIALHEPGVGGMLFKFAMASPEARHRIVDTTERMLVRALGVVFDRHAEAQLDEFGDVFRGDRDPAFSGAAFSRDCELHLPGILTGDHQTGDQEIRSINLLGS
jgi:hypothetical protein